MGQHFYGPYHWEFSPVADRAVLLDALEVFCDGETNLFIEVAGPSLWQRLRFWRMRSHYRTQLMPDMLSPVPSVFHIVLSRGNLHRLQEILRRDGLDERSMAHIKVYRGERGLAWFHGFCDEGDQTLCCSRHVDEGTLATLEEKLKVRAVQKFGELKSDRERKEDLERICAAMQRFRAADSQAAKDS